jgi:hypothetical protein
VDGTVDRITGSVTATTDSYVGSGSNTRTSSSYFWDLQCKPTKRVFGYFVLADFQKCLREEVGRDERSMFGGLRFLRWVIHVDCTMPMRSPVHPQ